MGSGTETGSGTAGGNRRVLVLVNNLSQASYRVRIAAIAPLLTQQGIDLDVQLRPRALLTRRRLLSSAKEYDAVLLQRRFLDPWEARLLQRSSRRIFYDIDDALMYHNRPVSWHSRWRTRRRFAATTRVVDHVVAGNEYLADIFRKLGRQATVVPTVVDPARYRTKVHADTDRPTLVWIGSRSTLPYLQQILPTLEQASKRVPGLRLLTIADVTVASSVLQIEHEPWSAATEAAALVRGDIGIAPTPTDPWTLGKCGFKIVQYMAAGLPVVASPIGANAELVRDGDTGFLPAANALWPDAVVTLARNSELRGVMGKSGRERVDRVYNLEVVADVWGRLLRS